MYQVIIVIHVLLGLGIIGLIMMQQGKGADAGASFGTGSAGSVFGAQGASSFLSRSTAILATLFFITSLGLAILNGQKGPAYDLMSPAAEAEKPAISASPEDVTNKIENILTDQLKSQDIPVTPEVAKEKTAPESNTSSALPEIKETVVPKAEEIKTVKEKKKAVPETAKGSEKK